MKDNELDHYFYYNGYKIYKSTKCKECGHLIAVEPKSDGICHLCKTLKNLKTGE